MSDDPTADDWIRPARQHGAIRIGDAYVPAGDLIPVVALMFRAAGRPDPIILDRPATVGPDVTEHSCSGWVIRTRDGHLRISVTSLEMAPKAALQLAATVATVALNATEEQPADEVRVLAARFHIDICGGTEDGADGCADCMAYAAAALRSQGSAA